MRLAFVLCLAAACSSEHVIGNVTPCCFDLMVDAPVPTCGMLPSCFCLLDLCDAGAPCKSDTDCPTLPLIKPTPSCLTCVQSRCRLSPLCVPPTPPPPSCHSDSECDQRTGCITCGNGARSCYAVRCTSGTCTVTPPACGCQADSDCAPPLAACEMCSDGVTRHCLVARCAGGQCLVEPDTVCPPTKPCANDADCGQSSCMTCGPATLCDKSWCSSGACQTFQPVCM